MSDVDLVQWLGVQLDEDERIARAAGGPWRELSGNWVAASEVDHRVAMVLSAVERAHIVAHDPARVLREIDAKRQIVDRYAWLREHGDTGGTAWVLQALALPYADRPGYREEWRP